MNWRSRWRWTIFALSYAVLAQSRGLPLSLSGAFAVWFACVLVLRVVEWTPVGALLANVLVTTCTVTASSRFRIEGVRAKAEPRRFDLAWRAATVAVCVAVVTVASHRIGSFASGMFAVFPVALGSFLVILHPRIGGPAAASVAAHVQAPLLGLVAGFLAVHTLAEAIGVWWSYAAGLAIAVAWNGLLWVLRQGNSQPAR